MVDRCRKQPGFTLIELLVVCVVSSTIAGSVLYWQRSAQSDVARENYEEAFTRQA
ncbi:MAG: type II secretion system protein, partial [Myxococcales bacterium]|nr:type II secretion system protein [Myxococcales bacterium]